MHLTARDWDEILSFRDALVNDETFTLPEALRYCPSLIATKLVSRDNLRKLTPKDPSSRSGKIDIYTKETEVVAVLAQRSGGRGYIETDKALYAIVLSEVLNRLQGFPVKRTSSTFMLEGNKLIFNKGVEYSIDAATHAASRALADWLYNVIFEFKNHDSATSWSVFACGFLGSARRKCDSW
jgi:hypothetical protein